jgi:shikimate kinase
VQRKANRPLLSEADPKAVMERLLAVREPVYATADITIASREAPHSTIVGDTLKALEDLLASGNAN